MHSGFLHTVPRGDATRHVAGGSFDMLGVHNGFQIDSVPSRLKPRVRHMNKKIIKPTPFGTVGIVWSNFNDSPMIVRVLLSKPGLSAEDQVIRFYPDSRMGSCPEIDAVATSIKALLEGDDISFLLDVADLNLCSAFQESVLRAEHAIPRGSISTYKLIASYLGKPNGARAAGNALANNPFPLIVPCHRAIRSDRHLGGYQGGLEMKQALLKNEGITFDKSQRAECLRFHYK
jgi:methylated-DNA-[protein]-cysteine S-methyltransferase